MVTKSFRLLDAHFTLRSRTSMGNFVGWRVTVKMDDGRVNKGLINVLTLEEAMPRAIRFIPTNTEEKS